MATAMANNQFINNRKNAWQRLEELLARLDRTSLRRFHREEVRELGRIYRRTASDLAIARAESRDPRLINYLNSLVIRAHGRIYRADAQGGERIRGFFARELPRTFRRTWRYTALSFGVFLVFGLIGFVGSHRDPEFSELVGVPAAFRELYIETKTPLVGRSESGQPGGRQPDHDEQHSGNHLHLCVWGDVWGRHVVFSRLQRSEYRVCAGTDL